MDDSFGLDESLMPRFPETTEKVRVSTSILGINAAAFARIMTKAFSDATAGGKQFDEVLKQVALRLSAMSVANALKPFARIVSGGLKGIFDGPDSATPPISPFAAGGVIGAPSYFPLGGGLGLAGEAGPEAIMPLARGSDGRLGVAMNGAGAPANVTVQIATPDAASFRRSEAYITGQIARAVARGQRSF